MHKIVLYCKSYRGDLERVKILFDSVKKFNVDKIPFYLSCPKSDLELFVNTINDKDFNIITDESINHNENLYNRGLPPRMLAFSTRLSIWKSKLAENYFCLDSDAYFIRNFYIKDFMFDEKTPFTVMHEQKELFNWSLPRTTTLGFDPQIGFTQERNKIMSLFDRTGKCYDFGPNPVIFHAKVLESLDEFYLKPNGLSTENLVSTSLDEYTWYGESLLAFDTIKIRPLEPIFKVFHYNGQYKDAKSQGYTEEHFSKLYLGIIMQSNANLPLKY